VSRDVEDEILPTLRELGIGFVPYSPLGRGFLTGRFQSADDLAANDHRRNMPRIQRYPSGYRGSGPARVTLPSAS
jgi:aryl-alcohol dehydrogenase-like predicted oxidoreductase